TGAATWNQTLGGDGSYVAVVRNPANASQSLRYMSFQNLGGGPGGFFRLTYDTTGAMVGGFVTPNLTVNGSNGQSIYAYEQGQDPFNPVGVNQIWKRPDTGGALVQLTAYTGGGVNDLAIQPTDWQHLVVGDNTHVFRSTNAGTAFTDITGNLLTGHANFDKVF